MRALHADAIFTGDAGVLRDAAVVVDEHGEIMAVGAADGVLPSFAGLVVERFRGVVLPGLVNAHTHLELSALHGQVPGGAGFVSWVEHLIGARLEMHPEADAAAIERAVADLDSYGTVAVGEVTNSLVAVRALARRGFVGCIFHEVFGVDRASVERRMTELPRVLEEHVGTWPTPDLAYSPTPHTLYTTHVSAVARLLREAYDGRRRVSVHIAEHAAERRFLEHGDGPVARWYESRLRLARDTLEWPGKPSIPFADELGALAPNVVCVHLTDARKDELETVARRGAAVVFCPRSNLFIEARLPPLLSARAVGLWPALGTDSLASNASLDVLSEARALADRFPTIPAVDLLRMATWAGAMALGRDDVGRIARGSRPGLLLIEGHPSADPCAFVLANVRAPRRWLVRRGGGTQ
ncbi:MAG: amidohydrolase family protein [Polyangiaceae bacterium]|jgi:cytosine/adenosine deaminase-related metal-dependent hydrolase